MTHSDDGAGSGIPPHPSSGTHDVLLSMQHISKSFPGVRALEDVSLDVFAGEVHALVGENGAGKSTLMKILTGAVPKDSGTIYLAGQEVTLTGPRDALALGIGMIHQELALIPYLDVGQNIFLGREPERGPGLIDWRTLYDQARQELDVVGIDVDPRATVADLPIAQQQMVEIGKTLSLDARLIIMDEPTSSLTERETARLFDLVRTLKAQGVTIIYISHRMEEIYEICDRVTVLRDGRVVGTYPVAETSQAKLVERMVGREVGDLYRKAPAAPQGVVLSVRHLTAACLRDISFDLARGEVVGLAGLVGSGRSTLARALFGAERMTQGEVLLDGKTVRLRSPRAAIRQGIGLVPEDRKAEALFLNMSVSANIMISALPRRARAGVIPRRRVRRTAQDFVGKRKVRTPSLMQRARNLSGGNQQKLAIARWLTLNPHVLILDEPTRGIDVGAKAEIHALMSRLAQQGVGILMISSELPEVLGVSDRILVMREGEIAAEFSGQQATQDGIMMAATAAARVEVAKV